MPCSWPIGAGLNHSKITNHIDLKVAKPQHAHLRPIEPRDCRVLTDLLLELAQTTGFFGKVVSIPACLEAAAFSKQPLVYGVIAHDQEQVLGFCLYHPLYSSWRGESGVYILDLLVKKEARKRGLGQRLLGHASVRARDLWGARFMKLDVAFDNTVAQGFYQELGFETDTSSTTMVFSADKFKQRNLQNGNSVQQSLKKSTP